jgi:predicted nucleic acid-binding protein
MKFVIDASIAVKWYVPEVFEKEAVSLLNGKNHFHVPELIFPEFCNVIWLKVRRSEITQTEGETIVSEMMQRTWTIHPHKKIIEPAYTGATSSGQTVYDWTYLALAVSLSCEMITADQKFYNALEKTPLKTNLKWIGDV